MKSFFSFVISIVLLGLCTCNNDNISGDNEITTSSILNYSEDGSIIDFNKYIY